MFQDVHCNVNGENLVTLSRSVDVLIVHLQTIFYARCEQTSQAPECGFDLLSEVEKQTANQSLSGEAHASYNLLLVWIGKF
jgi:hypothetical protein